MITDDQRAKLTQWGSTLARCDVHAWLVARAGRTITRAPTLAEALESIDAASSLDSRAAVYQVIALGEHDDTEHARIDVRVDPKALALAERDEHARTAQVVTAQAAAIAATDHKGVATAVKATSEALGEAHTALVAMVRVFGESGGAMLKAHGEAVKALDARAERAERRLSELETALDATRARERELMQLLADAVSEAERLKRNGDDLIQVLRSTFGPKVDQIVRGLASAAANEEGAAS